MFLPRFLAMVFRREDHLLASFLFRLLTVTVILEARFCMKRGIMDRYWQMILLWRSTTVSVFLIHNVLIIFCHNSDSKFLPWSECRSNGTPCLSNHVFYKRLYYCGCLLVRNLYYFGPLEKIVHYYHQVFVSTFC